MRPLAVDLFCGLGGWTSGLIEEGYFVVGFDIERHVYGEHCYPAQLVVQDVLTLHGSQFKDAAIIVASPPCQEYSYMAMPWTRAKAKAAAIRADETGAELERLNRLFSACFRIQREACEAAGRHVPLVVENVKGAIPWVGRSRWNFGSYHLWGDVPALMPPISVPADDGRKVPGFRFDGSGGSFQSASVAETGVKAPGMNWSDRTKRGQDFTRLAGNHALSGQKGVGPAWDAARGCGAHGMARWTNPAEGRKGAGAGAGAEWFDQNLCQLPSSSPRRKAASAMIAKIPLPLSRHIARTFLPETARA